MPSMLIADDNRQITDILSEYAKKEGFSVTRAYDGEEALRLFRAGAYEMVLLDVMMPKKDGFEVCRNIREESNVPVILITARGEDFERIMGLDIGADDYIVIVIEAPAAGRAFLTVEIHIFSFHLSDGYYSPSSVSIISQIPTVIVDEIETNFNYYVNKQRFLAAFLLL